MNSVQPQSGARPVILRVLTRLGTGGPPIHATTVTREMRWAGYESVLATGRCDEQDGDMSYLLQPDDPVYWIPEMSRKPSLWLDLMSLWRLVRLMNQLRPDIVHTHTAKAGALGRLAAFITRTPVVVHTFHGNVLSGYFAPGVSGLIALIERVLAIPTDAICVLARQQQEEIVGRFAIAPIEKVHVVPLGMDLSRLLDLDPPAPRKNCLTLGWLGRFTGVKDIPLLVSVVKETIRTVADVKFVIAGDGPERGAIACLAEEYGPERVEFVGWQNDVVPLIERCDLLFQTSRNEGTPVALIQGMAAHRPFVATPVGGIPEMAGRPAGERDEYGWGPRGVLCPASAPAFARIFAEIAAAPERRATMGRAAREFAASQYSLPSLLSKLDTLYTGLLMRAAARRRTLAEAHI